jgi:peptidoglycan/LPS O-acetylase OafA/YrhL
MSMKEKFVLNNFDLIRLLAAIQVVLVHSLHHLEVDSAGYLLKEVLMFFPGVPVFFFVSGFLISKSYENNSTFREYAQNRIFRIYPALIVCTIFAVCSVYFTGYFSNADVNLGEFFTWIISQISFVQFYNPDFMRGYGTGVLNGSLWTISVELQFYILVPFLYGLLTFIKKENLNIVLMVLICVFLILNRFYYELKMPYAENIYLKLYGVSFLPWFYMFLVGVCFQKNFNWIYQILKGRFLVVLIIYIVFGYFASMYFGFRLGNGINPILYILLAMLIFSLAYSFPMMSNKILRRNDISYGVYIYHIPVINIFIFYGFVSSFISVVCVLALTIFLAVLSWKFVEKPSLKFKRHPFNPLNN